MSFEWQERISPLQRGLLKISSIVGFLIFFGGIQLTVRGKPDLGGWIAGFGMFIAAEMRWGIQGLYNSIEQRRPQWLERFGYAKFFWVLFVIAFGLNLVGFVSILFFLTDYLT